MSNDKPRVLVAGKDWRIVRLTIPPQQRKDETDDGQRDWIEVADGTDLLGNTRWQQIDKKSGMSDLYRVVWALKDMVIATMIEEN